MSAHRITSRGLAALALGLVLAGCAEQEPILEGERFDVRSPLGASVAAEEGAVPTDPLAVPAENRSLPVRLPPPVANADWTHRGGTPDHAPGHLALAARPAPLWAVPIGEGNSRRARIAAAPVVAGGRIFTLDAAQRLAATSTAGQGLWQSSLVPETDRDGIATGGGLATDGARVFAATGFGELVAVDAAAGRVLWRQRLTAPVAGAPAVAGGLVHVVARDGSAWAIEVENGRIRWQLPGSPAAAGVLGAAGPAVTDRAVLLPFASGEVVAALRQGGVQLWGATVAGERRGRAYAGVADITADPVVQGDVVYVGTQAGRTVALKLSSGERIWTANQGATGPVAVAGDALFLVNDEARLMRLDAATGETVWTADLPYFQDDRQRRRKGIHVHYGPVLAGGQVVTVSSDGLIRLFAPEDGTLRATVDLPGGAAAAPALAGGVLYVVTRDGQLRAFR